MLTRTTLIAVAAIFSLGCPGAATAQDWPTRPVTMVVPFAAGGPVDALGRILAQYLTEVLGKQVIIDNVPGGGGMSGSLRVSQGTPDGYQFVLGSIGTHALNQTLSKKPLYNAATDFAPVALIADVGLVLLTRKELPAGNLQEFISYAKANQGKMQFASGGAGTSSHIGCVLLNQTIGIDVVHVPYRGGGPAQADLVAGRIDDMCNIASTVGQALESKQVNALAALTRERSPILPDLRTAARAGPDRLRRLHVERGVLSQGHAAGTGRQAQCRDRQGDGNAGFPRTPRDARPDRTGAGAPHARVSRQVRCCRNREMGCSDQGQRCATELAMSPWPRHFTSRGPPVMHASS